MYQISIRPRSQIDSWRAQANYQHISSAAKQKLEWIIFYQTVGKRNAKATIEAFQVVVAGTELINAYSELNDPIDQEERWKEDERRSKEGVTEHQVVDHDYIRALEYGMPPTVGWGMGIERFIAILSNVHSIKEVIMFPTLRPSKVK